MIFLNNLQNQKTRTVKKRKKALTLKNAIILLNGRQIFLKCLKKEYFQKENREMEKNA